MHQIYERDKGDMADGSRIREFRTRRGLLQRELAEMAGVTESAVRNYELGLRTLRPQRLEALARTLGVALDTLTDYGVETSRNALEVLFRLEEGFGARPEADEGGVRVAVDPAAPGAQKLDAAVRAWAAMRARRDSGEVSEEEYLDWKRGFGG
ncbi:MAG: helix-turn-helix domain-containing protein [Paratractidigestivibacter faecalis]